MKREHFEKILFQSEKYLNLNNEKNSNLNLSDEKNSNLNLNYSILIKLLNIISNLSISNQFPKIGFL